MKLRRKAFTSSWESSPACTMPPSGAPLWEANRSLGINMRIKGIFTAIVALGIAAGCAGAAPNDDAAATTPVQLSPIEEFTAAAFGTGLSAEVQRQQAEELELRRQEIMAQCMNEKGFEYIPHVAIFGGATDQGDIRPDDRDWVEQWGYGIVNTPSGSSRFFSVFADEMPANPNQGIWDNLSAAEAPLYWEALYGPPPEPTEFIQGVAISTGASEIGGCLRQAELEVPRNLMASSEFELLSEALNHFNTDFENNPEVVAADNDWANCMANRGHTGLTRQVDAERRTHNRFLDQFPTRASRNPSSPAVIEFQEQEIAIALNDLDCREQTDYRSRVADARFVAETQFVAENRAALEAFRAAAEEG